jgi:glycosyltransferase involved in cell wall biosynthesis
MRRVADLFRIDCCFFRVATRKFGGGPWFIAEPCEKPVSYMRIVNGVLGDASGGRWQVVCDYSRVLQRYGHQVLMLLGSKQRDLRRVPDGVDVEVVHNHGHYDYLAAWGAARRLRRFRPEIAIAHCSRSVALLKRALAGSAPVVAVTHSTKVGRLLPADAYLALSSHIRDRLGSGGRESLGKPCFVIPNMVAFDTAKALPVREPGNPPRMVALGRFDPVKGLDIFVRALGRLQQQGREFSATLAGAGVEDAKLRELVAQLNLQRRVSFPGWVEDVETLLAGADLLCVPARSDAFGLTPLQGAIAGVPLVLSRASGHLEMFEPEREALFCDIDDPGCTARQMARLSEEPGLVERLREGAFERAARCYSVPAVTEQLLQAIELISRNFNM